MVKLIWVDDSLLFKIEKIYLTQYYCICAEQYRNKLNMEIGDIIFVHDNIRPRLYKRLGYIRAFNDNKIIVGIMDNINASSKKQLINIHQLEHI